MELAYRTVRITVMTLVILMATLFVAPAAIAVLGAGGSAPDEDETFECWVDVYRHHHFAPDESDNGAHPSEDAAVTSARHDIERDYAMSRALGDTESIDAEQDVFDARRTLYQQAVRRDQNAEQGKSEWAWTEGERQKGLLVLERDETGWQVHEEHFWVSDGPCGP